MKKLICIISVLLISATGMIARQNEFPKLTGPYLGQKPPVKEPVMFAEGIVFKAHSSAAFSPDGTEVYFEIGTKDSNSTQIGFSKIIDGVWTKPEAVSFCNEDTYQSGNPFISPDNKKMFFTSFAPVPGIEKEHRENIWYSDRTSSGWSEPKPVSRAVNSLRIHWSISVSGNGTLYFQGERLDIDDSMGIYYSRLVDGEYAEPTKMGQEINKPGAMTTCPHIAPDESYMVFTLMGEGPEVSGIFISFKDESGKWRPAVMLEGGSVERGGLSPRVTPDGKYLFYVNSGMFWMPIEERIEQLRLKRSDRLEPTPVIS
jgi:WD40 repeat protein